MGIKTLVRLRNGNMEENNKYWGRIGCVYSVREEGIKWVTSWKSAKLHRNWFKNLGKNKEDKLNRIWNDELNKEKERTLWTLWMGKEKKKENRKIEVKEAKMKRK